MKIVVAMDKFRGSLTAREACAAVAEGLWSARRELEIAEIPVADGGEGTAEALMRAWNGMWIPARVTGPLPDRKVDAGFAWFDDRRLAVVEMAAASGSALLTEHEKNPLLTTTWGTGQLVAEAVRQGAQTVWLAVGGSATVDGGVGAAAALGWTFLDPAGNEVRPVGGQLERIDAILAPDEAALPPAEVLCDVTNPLCGPNGAARVFGPQKGATPRMVEQLERGLEHLAARIQAQRGLDIRALVGGGAAGGLAAGSCAFFGARLVPGVERVLDGVAIDDHLRDADAVVTGEGRFDRQSLEGKVVAGVLGRARAANVPVGVVAGTVALSDAACRAAGIRFAVGASPATEEATAAMRSARPKLVRAAAILGEELAAGLSG